MNIRRPWFKLALLLAVAALIGFVLPTTFAYIAAQSNVIVNTFAAPDLPLRETSVSVRVHKTVRNIGEEKIGPEGFRFLLENTSGGESYILTTGTNGFASIELPFNEEDLGKPHTYRLTEIDDERENVSYSDEVYTIRVHLYINVDGQLIASTSVNDVPTTQIVAEFVNVHTDMQIPDTGDDASLMLYAVMMLLGGAGLFLLLRRKNQVIG